MLYMHDLEIGEYILEQSVSVGAIPGLIVGGGGGGGRGRQSNFSAKQRPVLYTSGQTMLKCISKQNLIKIYYVHDVVQEL